MRGWREIRHGSGRGYPPGVRSPLVLLLLLACLLVVGGCGQTPEDVLPDPRDGRSGLQLSGRIGGRQMAVSDGLPALNAGDCDVNDGPDHDVCFVSRDLSGGLLVLIIENPAVLEAGVTLPVGSACADDAACEAVTDAAVVEIRHGPDQRIRATGGTLAMEVVEAGTRYRGEVDLQLPDGHLSGVFDVVPRPE